ncbi:choline/ethanolamine kinase [Niveomyces insectorum RCEF 264]|uniref:Choline/ethanolamine kinase n=1 Tax=Niveomyces insectorum RCEF 264 TaxID=1081102 RepID=A0A167UJV2_9HYPO|nr:choline/ethanolamine kinase [Niveomyces insectorum RCEF 264]
MSNQVPTNSPRSLPLRSALRDDSEKTPPLSGLPKAVHIAEPDVTDVQSPPPPPLVEDLLPRKQFTAGVAKRLSGRPAVQPLPSSSRTSVASFEGLSASLSGSSPAQMPADSDGTAAAAAAAVVRPAQQSPSLRPHITPLQHAHRHRNLDQISGRLLAQIADWIEHEKSKKDARKTRRVRLHTTKKTKSPPAADGGTPADAKTTAAYKRTTTGRADDRSDEDDAVNGAGDTTATSPKRDNARPTRQRAPSTGSSSSEVSLDRLQRILDDNVAALGIDSLANYVKGLRMGSSSGGGGTASNSCRRHLRSLRQQPPIRTASSDTDYVDSGDVLVPSCDVTLDNTKTLKYATTPAAAAAGSDAVSVSSRREDKERQAWMRFKNEIIRLAHTLRLKGWRRVPLDAGETISVERLSGALTNAVYVVSPPAELLGSGGGGVTPSPLTTPADSSSSSVNLAFAGGTSKRHPRKLLLRIYGPQVEHLIDRENELSVLRRLARKKIGPRLLGTFANGRFEQFFTATTLTAANLREPETSKQIAKRMRELHDGIELLEAERDDGPSVWRNWDRWLDAVEHTILYLDEEVRRTEEAAAAVAVGAAAAGATTATATTTAESTAGASTLGAWKTRGFVCGVAWPVFKALVEKHRALVNHYYGGPGRIRDQLVFAHNDTQYGNILRIRPDEKSPLLQPANEHKQLVVIDFEYAGANPPGVEFANHFTEWMYNYHDHAVPHHCHATRYPAPEQQRRFLRAYVDHRPEGSGRGPTTTTTLALSSSSSTLAGTQPPSPAQAPTQPQAQPPSSVHAASAASSIVDFMLDARSPPGGWVEEERRREESVERQVEALQAEARLWRAANSAQWVAWGIVQAKVPGMPPLPGAGDDGGDANGETTGADDSDGEAVNGSHEEEFDYLGYAQERALFFLGDCVQAGLVSPDELPADVRRRVKLVDF